MLRCVMVYKLSITLRSLSEIAEKELGQPLVINRPITKVVTIDTPVIPTEERISEIGKALVDATNQKNSELKAVEAKFVGYRSVTRI